MPTSSELTENKNVVIENVTSDKISINVNGEVQEIKNGLEDLKSLLQKLNAQSFQSGNKIYNIGTISNATFNAEIGRKTFNMFLCRRLTEAIQDYSPDVKIFLKNIKEEDKSDWETQSRYTRKANGYIISGFVGVLGFLLRKLIASGKDASSTGNHKDYLEVCIATTKRTLQLICYVYISGLWDQVKDKNYPFTREQLNTLDAFFNTDVELNIKDYVQLLRTLVVIFNEHHFDYPLPELKDNVLQKDSAFLKSCANLQEINNKLDTGQVTLATAFEAEIELTAFLTELKFLAGYKMVSVKDITYEEIRNSTVEYLHSYTFLGVDNEDNMYSEKFKYDSKPISTDAVLLYKNKYQEGINLFPFIIDINALTDESEVKICFYTYYEESKKRLTYSDINKITSEKNESSRDIKDPSVVTIIYNEDVEKDLNTSTDRDITRLKSDNKKYHEMKLNIAYKTFQKAKDMILG